MRFAFVPFVFLAASFSLVTAQTATVPPDVAPNKIDMSKPPAPPSNVNVLNWPEVQAVSGTVSVDNFPSVQDVNVVNPTTASAQYHLIGFTLATLTADSGVFGFTRACQVEFPGSRMCVLQEALTTTALPDLSGAGTNSAWISQPEVNPGWQIDCLGWSLGGDATNVHGRALDRDGRYGDLPCSYVLSVSCCAAVNE